MGTDDNAEALERLAAGIFSQDSAPTNAVGAGTAKVFKARSLSALETVLVNSGFVMDQTNGCYECVEEAYAIKGSGRNPNKAYFIIGYDLGSEIEMETRTQLFNELKEAVDPGGEQKAQYVNEVGISGSHLFLRITMKYEEPSGIVGTARSMDKKLRTLLTSQQYIDNADPLLPKAAYDGLVAMEKPVDGKG